MFNARGGVAAVEMALFIPVLAITAFLASSKHNRTHKWHWRWIYLNVLSLVRLSGAAVLIAAEIAQPPDVFLFSGSYVLVNTGVSLLLLASAELLKLVGRPFLAEIPNSQFFFRAMTIFAAIAIGLGTAGAFESAESSDDLIVSGNIMRKASSFCTLAVFVLILEVHGVYWVIYRKRLGGARPLLLALSASLPFLFIRVLYQILSAFSPNQFGETINGDSQMNIITIRSYRDHDHDHDHDHDDDDDYSNSTVSAPYTFDPVIASDSMSRFNAITGSIWIYLSMSLLMEAVVILIDIGVGMRTTHTVKRLDEDEDEDVDVDTRGTGDLWRNGFMTELHADRFAS